MILARVSKACESWRWAPLLILLTMLGRAQGVAATVLPWSGELTYTAWTYQPLPPPAERALLKAFMEDYEARLALLDARLAPLERGALQARQWRADRVAAVADLDQARERLGGLRWRAEWYFQLQRVDVALTQGQVRLVADENQLLADLPTNTISDGLDAAFRAQRLEPPPLLNLDISSPLGRDPVSGQVMRRFSSVHEGISTHIDVVPTRPNPFRALWCERLREEPFQRLAAAVPGLPLRLRVSQPNGSWREWRLVAYAP